MAIAYLDSDAPVVMRMPWSDVTGGQARRALVGPDHSHVRVSCLVRTRRAHPVRAREQGRDMQAHRRVLSRTPFLSAECGVCGVRSLDGPALQHVSTRVLQAFLTSLEDDQSGAPPTPFVRTALADGDESNACEVRAPVLCLQHHAHDSAAPIFHCAARSSRMVSCWTCRCPPRFLRFERPLRSHCLMSH